MAKKLTWSAAQDPNSQCGYHHSVAHTPLGDIQIEWKGWKERTSFDAILPWNEMVYGDSLEETQANVQKAWDEKILECSQP